MRQAEGHYLYIHVPFCEQKCSYCDFFTITDPDRTHPLAANWLELCARELELWIESGNIDALLPVQTIFFGGGTPSLLSPSAIGRFVQRVAELFSIPANVEITLETQPDTVDERRMHEFAVAGVTRFSIGVQTFDQAILGTTGRRHSVQQSRSAIVAAQSTVKFVSIDLISAWPGQTLAQWSGDLAEAISFQPDHISCYELTFHAGTQLSRDQRAGRTAEAEEDLRAEMFQHTRTQLIAAGYDHYEISNYARGGARSLHNQNYWQLGNFVGLGAGAYSCIFPNRYANPNSAGDYAKHVQAGQLFRRVINPGDEDIFFAENLTMALRLTEGAERRVLQAKLGTEPFERRAQKFQQLIAARLIEMSNERIRLSDEGQLKADAVISFLL